MFSFSKITFKNRFSNMRTKEIKQCPLKKEKCSYRVSRMNTTSGCSLYEDVNLCAKCTKHREKQSKHTIEEVKKYHRYRQPGCKL